MGILYRDGVQALIIDLISKTTGGDAYSNTVRELEEEFVTTYKGLFYRTKIKVSAGGHGGPDITIEEFLDGFFKPLEKNPYSSSYRNTVVYTSKPGTTGRATVTIDASLPTSMPSPIQ